MIYFIKTEGSESTKPKKSYKATWKGENVAKIFYIIEIPDIIPRYFNRSNIIDVQN